MLRIILLVLLFSPASYGDDLLNVLDGEAKQQVDGLDVQTKKRFFSTLVKRPTAEQNIFFQFLEKGDYRKALYQWSSAFESSSFASSDNGKALYGYLLYKNGLKLTGLETLFQSNPQRVKPKLINLWQSLMQTNEKLWALAEVRWSSQWTKIFGVPAEVTVTAKSFGSDLSVSQLEKLLRKTASNTWARSWVEWNYVTALLLSGQDIKAAKLLKHLQTVKINNPISKDLMNITAARVLYQNGYLSQAIRYYNRVTKGSDYWFEAREEMGWAELRLGKPQNTLAHTQTLLVNAFEPDVGPESFYLESLANLKVCDYQGVSKTLAEFRDRFRRKAATLLKLKQTPKNDDVKKLFSVLSQKRANMTELAGHGRKLPRLSTRDEQLYFLVHRQSQLRAEADIAKDLYSQSLSEGTALVGFQAKMEKFRKAIESRARTNFTAALNRVKKLADGEINEISSVLKKMQIVEAELIQQIALSDRVIKDSTGQASKVKKGTTGSKDRYTLTFPFQGEVWFDEIDNYKVDIAKGCQSGAKKKL